MANQSEIRLTQFSHGAGCGCKLSPKVLENLIPKSSLEKDAQLLVGNDANDDAVVYDLGNGTAVVSTTDFFTPIVDDPGDFGRIASVNAISDVYAMGARPLVAIAILGWPIDKIDPQHASEVLSGAHEICGHAGIQVAGGHSIDNAEPIFGLAVTGLLDIANLKRNNTAKPGSSLYLTKRLGVGLITTAQKRGIARDTDLEQARASMLELNLPGIDFGKLPYINAMTDVTGFGLLGHLIEMCGGLNVSAVIDFDRLPKFDNVDFYIQEGSIPGGTNRNWDSYGHQVSELSKDQIALLADPQTSGGLLVSVDQGSEETFESTFENVYRIGRITEKADFAVSVN